MSTVFVFLKSWENAWDRFWFESYRPDRMRRFSRAFGWVLFFFLLTRTPDLEFFYSENGILTTENLRSLFDHIRFHYSILETFSATGVVWAVHWTEVLCALGLGLGMSSLARVFALVGGLCHLQLMYRNMGVSFGIDLISQFYYWYLVLMGSGKNEGIVSRTLSSVGYRLCQIQVCIIYAYSGLEKLKGQDWWTGLAIWDVVANVQLVSLDYSLLAWFIPALVVMAYVTLLWEIYFPAMVWNKQCKPWVLGFGVLFHAGIAVTVNIPFFSALMISFYLLFIDPSEINLRFLRGRSKSLVT